MPTSGTSTGGTEDVVSRRETSGAASEVGEEEGDGWLKLTERDGDPSRE
jgi:hypothetical protein